ncbi:MAG: polyphosphate polymerase domain-containing protein [Planctomycetales bacterium]|nr:polyphosphate polymerase domain-containing protein [Planctomycetales bacterium]
MAIKMQAARFELKYIINEEKMKGIRRYLKGRLTIDEHDDPDNPQGYTVCSLYCDSPTFKLYDQTFQGHKNRFKLRIRFYDNNPNGPAFLEIKRRETDIIRKKRTAVTKRGALQILKGAYPSPSMLYPKGGNLDALNRFCNLARSLDARGAAYIVYTREAYVSPDSDHVRVTFDRDLYGGFYYPGEELYCPADGVRPTVGGIVLELKFTDRFPTWMHELVQIFQLERTSVPKYCLCVESMELLRTGLPTRPSTAIQMRAAKAI